MKVNFITAFDSNRDIGGTYNSMIENIHDEWIFIKDGDCMFLRSDYGNQIAEIIATHGKEYDVLGCLTNRIYGQHQRYGELSDNPDMNYHIDIANKCYEDRYSLVKGTSVNVAAMVMCFKRSFWEKGGGFNQHSISFDREFTDKVQSLGGKLGIMQGLYVFHLYRWGKENPAYYSDHLKK